MVLAVEGVAQATAVVGYDLADGKWWQESARDRIMTQIGLVGSANGGDCKVELFFGDQKVGEWANTLGGAAGASVGLTDDHMIALNPGYVLKAGIPIHVRVVTQPSSNPIIFGIELKELRRFRAGATFPQY